MYISLGYLNFTKVARKQQSVGSVLGPSESQFLPLPGPPAEEVERDGDARAMFYRRVSALCKASLVVRGGWRETAGRRKASTMSELLSVSHLKH